MLGGELDIPLQKQSSGFLIVNLSPRVGYFIIDNLGLGLSLESELVFLEQDRSLKIGTGPFVRYYIGKYNIKAFGHFSYVPSVFFRNTTVSNEFLSHIQPGFGVCYMLRPTIGIEAILLYDQYISNDKYSHYESFASLKIGFQIFIPHKVITNN